MSTEVAPAKPASVFEIVRRIGVGGMGEVYEAIRIAPGGVRKTVALKKLALDDTLDAAARKRFLHEARVSAQLDHPNIVRVYDFVIEAEKPTLVMELLRGHTLDALVSARAQRCVPAWVALTIADQVLAGLEYAHALGDEQGTPLGLVHRDVTPANVFVCRDGLVKLLDFGLAKTRAGATTATGDVRGTFAFLPPERWRGDAADVRSDLFQVGGLMFFALTGTSPHGAGGELGADALGARVRVLRERADISADAAALLERALAFEPGARFADASSMRTAIFDIIRRDYSTSIEPLPRWLAKEVTAPIVDRTPRPPPAPRRPTTEAEIDLPSPFETHGLPARFEILGVIASGGMGLVLDGRDAMLDRDVAIKLLDPGRREDPELRARMLREARLAAMLRHPRIVAVYDVDPDGRYIVMERMRGGTLEARLAGGARLPASETRRIGTLLLEALHEAHTRGIIHRDVKPSNILFDDHDEPHLADFGVAHLADSKLTGTGTRIGTPAYMAPEQLRDATIDARADLYAMGATLYEAATGKRLHEAGGRAEHPLADVLEATSDELLAHAIACAVEDKPADRFGDARAFIAGLSGEFQTRRMQRTAKTAAVAPRPPGGSAERSEAGGVGWGWLARDAKRSEAYPGRRRRRAVIWVGAALSAVVAASAIAIWKTTPVDVHVAARHAEASTVNIALLPFSIRSSVHDYARTGVPHWFARRIEAAAGVTAIGYYRLADRVGRADAPDSEWLAAARALGAHMVVRGSIETAAGDLIRATIVVETIDGKRLHEVRRDVDPEALPTLVQTTTSEVLRVARELDLERQRDRTPTLHANELLELGRRAVHAHRFSDAEPDLRTALRRDPSLVEARYLLALVAWWTSRGEAEIEAKIRDAEQAGLDAERVGVVRGLQLVEASRYPAAIAHFERLVQWPDAGLDARYGHFEALYHGGRPDEAMAVYRDIAARAPTFTLGVIHTLPYYAARGDKAGIAWSLAHGQALGEDARRLWDVLALIAQGSYDAGLRKAELATEVPSDNAQARTELRRHAIWIHLVQGRTSVAASLIEGATAGDNGWGMRARLAIAAAQTKPSKGDALFSQALDAALQQRAAGGWAELAGLIDLAATVLPSSDQASLEAVSRELEAALRPDDARSSNVQVVRALLAGAIGDHAILTELQASVYPEPAAIAAAFELARAGKPSEAAAQWQRAIAASGDGRHHTAEWFYLARMHHGAGNSDLMTRACREVLAPRVVAWSWAFAATTCRKWIASE